jgi:hypothetical protein
VFAIKYLGEYFELGEGSNEDGGNYIMKNLIHMLMHILL